MKNLIMLSLLSLIVAFSSYSQEEEEPYRKPKKEITRMGGGGGFTPSLLFWDTETINEVFFGLNLPQFSKSPMMLYGGQGYGYIMFVENLRIGGMGAGGGKSVSTVIGNIRRDLEASVNFGGVTLEYVFPLTERLDLVGGMLLGGGGMSFKLRRDNYGAKKWDDLIYNWDNVDSVYNFSYNLEGSFFIYKTSLNIEYALLRWLGVRFGVSYLGMISPSWELDEKFEVVNVPDKLNGNGFMLNAGIFFGTFLF